MKKIMTLKNACIMLGMASLPLMLTSCNKDKDNDGPMNFEYDLSNPSNTEDTEDKKLSPEEQKKFIDEVGSELLGQYPSEELQEFADLANFILSNIQEGEWNINEIRDLYGSAMENSITKTKDPEEYSIIIEEYNSTDADENPVRIIEMWKGTTNYAKLVADLAQFNGHFILKDDKWSKSEGDFDNLELSFKDESGKDCMISVTASEKTVLVHLDEFTKYDDEGESFNETKDDDIIYKGEIRDRLKQDIWAEVPEQATLIITRGGKDIAKYELNTKLDMKNTEEFNLVTDVYNLDCALTIGNYKVAIDKLNYENKKAEFNIQTSSAGKPVMTYNINSNMDIVTKDPQKAYDIDFEKVDATIKIDFLNKIQVKGTIADLEKFGDALDEIDRYYNKEEKLKTAVKELNDLMDLGLYFNNGNTKQANVVAEPVLKDGQWSAEYMVIFEDGTSMLLENYAAEDDFGKTMNLWEKLRKEYKSLIKLPEAEKQ